ncbi:MAG: hypothetical protein PUP91_29825 [Rhizonema sp. PD37]|nr:hypothetical protein [Rhizonema sp. PD37]
MRLTTQENEEQHLTIPAHDPIKVGTLNSILQDVASHFNLEREEVLNRLFL